MVADEYTDFRKAVPRLKSPYFVAPSAKRYCSEQLLVIMAQKAQDVWCYDDPIETGWPSDEIYSRLRRRAAQYCRVDSDAKEASIRKASGSNAVEAMESCCISPDYNVRIALYKTKSEDNWRKVKDAMVKHFKKVHPAFSEGDGGSGGRPSDATWHYVFLALQTPPVLYWDDLQDGLESCKNYVEKYADKKHVEKFYIGIASGEDDVSAMKRHYDKTKEEEGLNEVIAIYEEKSDQGVCRYMEGQLVQHIKLDKKRRKKMLNKIGGGSGAPSGQPKFYVYLALRIKPAGH